jgi:hypothetical protein
MIPCTRANPAPTTVSTSTPAMVSILFRMTRRVAR